MSEQIAKYYTDPEELLCDSFIKLWRRENLDMAVVINSILETVGMAAAGGPYRKLYRSTLQWEKRLFDKDPVAYRCMVERRLKAMLGEG